jgi:CRP/FNR family transcriptional regulator, cyclic AMP receptor protein
VSADGALYDPRIALQFFKSSGTPQKVPAGTVIFAEKDKGARLLRKPSAMYLLLTGEVQLLAGRKAISTVKAGEVFGELAAISAAPRSASAVAKTDCRLIALGERQFREALRRKPSFALMLMSLMIRRLRATIAQLEAAGEIGSPAKAAKEGAAFDPKHLADLARGLSDDPPVYFARHQTIVESGQAATRMYLLTEGRAVVKIGNRIVERLGPGGVFGEAALVEQAPRLATVVAEAECALLPITRKAFLALVKMSPGFAERMLGSLAERVRYTSARLHATELRKETSPS